MPSFSSSKPKAPRATPKVLIHTTQSMVAANQKGVALKLDPELLKSRAEALEAASKNLKTRFVGIDRTIDELIDAMRVWALMPEALTRPVIINLWGMTGVGKTDLVRHLISSLDMQDRFIEVELSNGDSTSWYSSVSSVLTSNGLNDSAAKIVLFDEIQRFRTIDSEGKDLTSAKFSDFWELLSDGRLSRRDRNDFDLMHAELVHSERQSDKKRQHGEEVEIEEIGIYEANQLKNLLEMDEDIQQIIDIPRADLIRRIERAKVAKRVFEPVDHSKTLILISGNLDEAFSMAMQTAEADVDADIFSAFTEKVSIVDIKQALSTRFKPEQVARFGNIHLIYRSLGKKDFQFLIHREVVRIAQNVQSLFGLAISVTERVEEVIYRNGVFPVQGVRPVFSSIGDILESNLSRYVLEAATVGATSIDVDYDSKAGCLRATISGGKLSDELVMETEFIGRLDRVRATNVADVVANISVHEAGHAVAYIALFGLAPLQLVSRVASTHVAGFTFPHEIYGTRQSILDKIQIFLAGGVAEEIVFGESNASTGRLTDREQATGLALDFVRKYGFDQEFHANYALDDAHAMDKTVTDSDVEKMITRLDSEVRELLLGYEELLRQLADALQAEGRINVDQVAALARNHGLTVDIQPEGYLHVPSYVIDPSN